MTDPSGWGQTTLRDSQSGVPLQSTARLSMICCTDSWYQGEYLLLVTTTGGRFSPLKIVKVPGSSFRTANTASTFQLDSSTPPPTPRSRLSPAGRTIFPRFDRRNNLRLGCKRGMPTGNGITHGECRRASRHRINLPHSRRVVRVTRKHALVRDRFRRRCPGVGPELAWPDRCRHR